MNRQLWITIIMIFGSILTYAQNRPPDLLDLSQGFMYAAKSGGDTKSYMDTLASIDQSQLFTELSGDNKKKAFFINLYNAYVQTFLKADPEQYKKRSAFFGKKQIMLAGHHVSLDKLEHGLLRHSRNKWSLGYFGKLFPGRFEKKLRVNTIDYRIHFTLNCGAKSCPAIAYYKPEQLDEQLDLATKVYLANEAVYIKATNTLQLPALMSWFRADFGGKKNERKLCHALGIIPDGVKPRIKYKKYNWALYLNNYKTT